MEQYTDASPEVYYRSWDAGDPTNKARQERGYLDVATPDESMGTVFINEIKPVAQRDEAYADIDFYTGSIMGRADPSGDFAPREAYFITEGQRTQDGVYKVTADARWFYMETETPFGTLKARRDLPGRQPGEGSEDDVGFGVILYQWEPRLDTEDMDEEEKRLLLRQIITQYSKQHAANKVSVASVSRTSIRDNYPC